MKHLVCVTWLIQITAINSRWIVCFKAPYLCIAAYIHSKLIAVVGSVMSHILNNSCHIYMTHVSCHTHMTDIWLIDCSRLNQSCHTDWLLHVTHMNHVTHVTHMNHVTHMTALAEGWTAPRQHSQGTRWLTASVTPQTTISGVSIVPAVCPVCCSVLWRVAVWCSVLQHVAACCSVLRILGASTLHVVCLVCYSMLQCGEVWHSVTCVCIYSVL